MFRIIVYCTLLLTLGGAINSINDNDRRSTVSAPARRSRNNKQRINRVPSIGTTTTINQKLAASHPSLRPSLSHPNVIFILADDLGYGDLGFSPFNSDMMKALQTPNLQRMAKQGKIFTNFHAASPICSPSRVAIMTGLFPWRVGVDFIYSQDPKKDGSEELDHEQLPLIPNIAMTMQSHGYYTAHIGKWHLGGISQFDIPNRQNGNCTVPGINQYGFDEYVAMTEHMHSSRYWTQQRQETYAKGANHLYRNDVKMPVVDNPPILTDKQTSEAIRVIREQTALHRPFFLNLWYDAPHR